MLHPRPAHRASYPLLCSISPHFRLRRCPAGASPFGCICPHGHTTNGCEAFVVAPSGASRTQTGMRPCPAWDRICPLKRAEISVTLAAVSETWYARGAFPTSGRAYPAHNDERVDKRVNPNPLQQPTVTCVVRTETSFKPFAGGKDRTPPLQYGDSSPPSFRQRADDQQLPRVEPLALRNVLHGEDHRMLARHLLGQIPESRVQPSHAALNIIL